MHPGGLGSPRRRTPSSSGVLALCAMRFASSSSLIHVPPGVLIAPSVARKSRTFRGASDQLDPSFVVISAVQCLCHHIIRIRRNRTRDFVIYFNGFMFLAETKLGRSLALNRPQEPDTRPFAITRRDDLDACVFERV